MKIKLLLSALVAIWLSGCVSPDKFFAKKKECIMGCGDTQLIIPPIIDDKPKETK
jgi:hypothetical protein